ncbi:dynamin family protein [Colletotrichum orchidophilum]|uniref:Dynamin family protein n=1 Tax=Colletotrichum orchidophilum TaxID=1209926 RepID=A0A1G4B0A0_9PEZI|nr:dynamin family protein [Colletotrichum orchidophilum]OHE94763.1 dynamin family protein [Colletotrichum orchidophilum]
MAPAHSKTHDTGLGNRNLLDKIDKLRELGVSKQIALPQLVVVGDQSSGKSSVLESLTGYYFPRSVGLCTRHSTEIVCRREAIPSIVVTIQPAEATPERAELARLFRHELKELKGQAFADVLREAARVMGLRSNEDSEGASFSKDVLRVEICGPHEEHLTVIDVPGIFENAQDGISTARDVTLVKSMVKDYIKDSRTIILAVIPCNVDVATQTILTYAAEADPEGKRTLGVLTKPDLVSENATREAAMDLVRGKRRDIQVGYYVVKNRGADDTCSSKEDRDLEEKMFFGEEPWSRLDKSRLGIPALRIRLRELLMDRTKSEFPNVRREINERLAEAKAQLEALGQPRSTADEQRAYLGKIEKLLVKTDDSESGAASDGDNSEDENDTRDDLYDITFPLPSDEYGELDVVLSEPCRCPAPQDDSIMKHLEQLYLKSRGFEMGTAKLLIHVEREGRSIIYNPSFDRALNKVKAERNAKKFDDLKVCLPLDMENTDVVKYDDLKKAPSPAEDISATSCIIHDVLQSYYEVASARFSDMVCTQVIDYVLLGANNSPLNVLSANRIFKMTAEQLDMVAGEDALSKSAREMLKNDIKLFEQGRKVLRT